MNESSRRPRDLALLLLAATGESPRQRARDQQADRAGMELRRRVLDRLADLDPEPEAIEPALAEIVHALGEPSGPARGVCALMRQEWDQARLAPGLWDWLRAEALAASRGESNRRTRRGPGPAP
ncbi:MAG: hypothetical protein WKF75_09735 [Singulisphaera sp.]